MELSPLTRSNVDLVAPIFATFLGLSLLGIVLLVSILRTLADIATKIDKHRELSDEDYDEEFSDEDYDEEFSDEDYDEEFSDDEDALEATTAELSKQLDMLDSILDSSSETTDKPFMEDFSDETNTLTFEQYLCRMHQDINSLLDKYRERVKQIEQPDDQNHALNLIELLKTSMNLTSNTDIVTDTSDNIGDNTGSVMSAEM